MTMLRRVLVAAILVAVGAAMVVTAVRGPGMVADPETVSGQVAIDPSAAVSPPPRPTPTITVPELVVLCSDLREYRVPRSLASPPQEGTIVDLHGAPCIVVDVPAVWSGGRT